MTRDHYKNELVKELRESAGLTQEQLAELVNTHWGTISRVESGVSCSFPLLCKLAESFEIDWRKLIRLDEREDQKFSASA
jgi:transcriptional regulator with XRE-family HTH domain